MTARLAFFVCCILLSYAHLWPCNLTQIRENLRGSGSIWAMLRQASHRVQRYADEGPSGAGRSTAACLRAGVATVVHFTQRWATEMQALRK